MATRQVMIDDLDSKSDADETIDYALDGVFYEIDLAEANGKKLRDALAPFLKVSREVQPKEALRRATGNGGTAYGSYDPAVVRTWALAKGIEVNDKGRVPEDVVRKWRLDTQG